jgi:hypothetical protein
MSDIPAENSRLAQSAVGDKVRGSFRESPVITQRGTINALPDILAQRLNAISQAASQQATRDAQAQQIIRVEGRVVESDPVTRQYTLRTAQGEIVIRTPENTQPPPVQSHVRVDIPLAALASVVKPDAPVTRLAQALPVEVQIEYPSSRLSQNQISGDPRISQTPVELRIQQNPQLAQENSQNALPVVRIEAIAAEKIEQILARLNSSLPLQEAALLLFESRYVPSNATAADASLIQTRAVNSVITPAIEFSQTISSPNEAALPAHLQKFTINPARIVQVSALPEANTVFTAGAPVSISTDVSQNSNFGFLPPQLPSSPASLLFQPLLQTDIAALPLPSAGQSAFIRPAVMSDGPAFSSIKGVPLLGSAAKAGEIAAHYIGMSENNVPVLQVSHPVSSPAVQGFEYQSIYASALPLDGDNSFLLFFHTLGNATPGTQIILSTADSAGGANALSPAPASALPHIPAHLSSLPALATLMLGTGSWDVMNDIQRVLAQAAPQAAQAMQALSPSPANPAQLMPAALFFLAAMRGGDLSQWLGEKAQDILVKSGKGERMSRLSNEGNALNRMFGEMSGNEWRSMALPFYYDGAYQKAMLHMRQDGQNGEDGKASGKSVRFIFDLAYDRIGDVQLDGLFHGGGRLDLILRTETPFSQIMQAEMRRLYAGAIEQANVVGELSFQNSLQQWVKVTHA